MEKENAIPTEVESRKDENDEATVIVPEKISRIIDTIPDESDRREIKAVIMSRHFQGPLPPPEILAAYKTVLPGSPERVFTMAEKEQQHRHDVENAMISGALKQQTKGQVLGFILALLFGAASFILGLKGQTWLAGILGTSTVIGLAVVFVLNKQPHRDSKNDANNKPEASTFGDD